MINIGSVDCEVNLPKYCLMNWIVSPPTPAPLQHSYVEVQTTKITENELISYLEIGCSYLN